MLKFILAPVVGGIIGYITNDLAIKMLFRPRKAIFIGKWHVPFTPGLIPQQKNRIAASIGKVISTQLLNVETIEQTILSEKTKDTIRDKISNLLEGYKDDYRTVEQIAEIYVEPEQIGVYKEDIQECGTKFLMEKIEQADIGKQIIQSGFSVLDERLQMGFLGFLMDESFYRGMENTIAKVINEAIAQKAPSLISNEIRKLEDDILDMPLHDIYELQRKHIPALADEIVNIYEMAVKNNIGKVLEVVDIESIVVDKVRSFSAVQLEQMIFGIMKKELNAIVYLGALLGFLMGFINLLW